MGDHRSSYYSMSAIDRLFQNEKFLSIIGHQIKFLDFVYPKDHRIAIFSSLYGKGYGDNSRFLFEKLRQIYGKEMLFFWLSSDKSLVDHLNDKYATKCAVYLYSVEGFKLLLKSKFVFSSYLGDYIPGIRFSKKTIVFHLHHGIPLKNILGEDKHLNAADSRKIKKYINKNIAYWVCSSKIEKTSIQMCSGLSPDKVLITGSPRNDYFIDQINNPTSDLGNLFPFLKKTIVLYAPTWRPNEVVKFFPFPDVDIEKLITILEKTDAYLLIRGHLADDILQWNGKMNYDGVKGNRIILANRELFPDVQELLPFVDIIISDYSGIWVDYLLSNKPIIFIPYDIKKYEEDPGLLFDYNAITPGPKVYNFTEFLLELEEYLINPSKDAERRVLIKNLFHKYDDGLAYERIFRLIQNCK